MKNVFMKIIVCFIAIFIIGLPIFGAIQTMSKPNVNETSTTTLISEETGTFSEIETEEETTEVATTKLQEKLTEKEIIIITTQQSTTSSAQKSKEVTVTEMVTEKTTAAPTTEYITEIESEVEETDPPTQAKSSYGTPLGRMYVTGYTAEEGFPEGSATASGYGVRSGYCALNNSQRKSLGLKYGDQIYVEGLGTYTIMDCGCSWGVVDIWVYSNAEAYAMTGYYNVYIV